MAQQALRRLDRVWDDMGIGVAERETRMAQAVAETERLFATLLQEEERRRDQMRAQVAAAEQAIDDLLAELDGDDFEYDADAPLFKLHAVLSDKAAALRAERDARARRAADLHDRERALHATMGKTGGCEAKAGVSVDVDDGATTTEGALSLRRIAKLEARVGSLQTEHDRRVAVVEAGAQTVRAMLAQLEMEPRTAFERLLVDRTALHSPALLCDDGLAQLAQLEAALAAERVALERNLADTLTRIRTFWDRLEVPVAEREGFLRAHGGCGVRTRDAYAVELERLVQLRAANMERFIEHARRELIALWDATFVGAAEREHFIADASAAPAPVPADADADGATLAGSERELAAYEAEIDRRQRLLAAHQALYQSVRRRRQLWDELRALDEQEDDPARLSNRGGRLLREEKFRRSAARELPQLEARIGALLARYAQDTGQPFTVDGVPYAERMPHEQAEYDQAKEAARQRRLQARREQQERDATTTTVSAIGGGGGGVAGSSCSGNASRTPAAAARSMHGAQRGPRTPRTPRTPAVATTASAGASSAPTTATAGSVAGSDMWHARTAHRAAPLQPAQLRTPGNGTGSGTSRAAAGRTTPATATTGGGCGAAAAVLLPVLRSPPRRPLCERPMASDAQQAASTAAVAATAMAAQKIVPEKTAATPAPHGAPTADTVSADRHRDGSSDRSRARDPDPQPDRQLDNGDRHDTTVGTVPRPSLAEFRRMERRAGMVFGVVPEEQLGDVDDADDSDCASDADLADDADDAEQEERQDNNRASGSADAAGDLATYSQFSLDLNAAAMRACRSSSAPAADHGASVP